MLNPEYVKEIIFELIADMIDEPVESRDLDSVTLTDLGINSLGFARLLIKLEQRLGKDPFHTGQASIADMDTVAKLIEIYVLAEEEPAEKVLV